MVKVCSKVKLQDTGIDIIKDCEYKYSATGIWVDWFIPCNADGFHHVLSSLVDTMFGRDMKRMPSANWFQLVGVIKGSQEIAYEIKLGVKGTFLSPESGRLHVFANDADFAYWNNFGYVELCVKPNK
jgi:hypothetical protein